MLKKPKRSIIRDENAEFSLDKLCKSEYYPYQIMQMHNLSETE